MSGHREVPVPGWVAPARAWAQRPPAMPRLPFAVAGQAVGSVAPGVLEGIELEAAIAGTTLLK
ncbi:NUDIX hydrolase, partial [Paracidovorax avenae]